MYLLFFKKKLNKSIMAPMVTVSKNDKVDIKNIIKISKMKKKIY